MHSGKLHYVSANPGGGAATLSGASSVYCVLGTPPQWRRYSRLVWRQGPAALLEDVSGYYISKKRAYPSLKRIATPP